MLTLFIGVSLTAQNYIPLSYYFNGTPVNGVKIKTNLPYTNNSQMPTLIIEGYNYGKGKSIGVMLNWYVYNGIFFRYAASSHGAYAPPIKLANENGKVVIFLDLREYYNRFQIRTYAKGLYADDNSATYQNWMAVDEALSGSNIVDVPYEKEDEANLYSEPVSITTDTDAVLNFLNTDNSWQYIQYIQSGLRRAYVGINSANNFVIAKENGGNIAMLGANVGIGTTVVPSDSKLAVNGKILAKEVKVSVTDFPDYVFENNYDLPTLQEVEKHIKEKGHLPNIPSAKEVEKDEGIELGEMNKKLLEKIEELTLYTIQQEKKIQKQESELRETKNSNNNLLLMLDKLEKRIDKLENR